MRLTLGFMILCVSPAPFLHAQSGGFATRVIAYDTRNQAGGGIFNPANALGAPVANHMAVHSLGVGGFLTLGFDVAITDGPGADFLIFENAFAAGTAGQIFSEAVFVEVSSNGQDFARFPTHYQGPSSSGGPFSTAWAGYYAGFAGIKPSKGGMPGVDNFDVVQAGGDSFDLADLASHALVQLGKVDLTRITQMRLVDVVAGVSKDSGGNTIQDPSAGSADINAVAVVHHQGNVHGTGPKVEVVVPGAGDFIITLSDPAGLSNLDPTSIRVALDGIEIPFALLLPMMKVVQFHTASVTLQLGSTLPPGLLFQLSVSARNKAGFRSGQTRTR